MRAFAALLGFVWLGLGWATAAPVQVVYSGVIQTGADGAGLFGGPAGQTLDGLRFRLTYYFDPSIGSFSYGGPGFYDPINNFSYGGRYVQVGVGEYDYGTSPSLGAVLHIDGLPSDVPFFGTYSFMFGHNSGDMSGQSHGVSINSGVFINAQVQATHGAISASLVGPFSYDLNGDDYFDGFFQLGAPSTYGRLTIKNLSVDLAATTPLPTALPLFAAGLGALGLMAWRRKRMSAA